MRGTPGNRVGYQRWLIVCGAAATALAIATGCGNVAGAPPAVHLNHGHNDVQPEDSRGN